MFFLVFFELLPQIHPLVFVDGKVKAQVGEHGIAFLFHRIGIGSGFVTLKGDTLSMNPFGKAGIGRISVRHQTVAVLSLEFLQLLQSFAPIIFLFLGALRAPDKSKIVELTNSDFIDGHFLLVRRRCQLVKELVLFALIVHKLAQGTTADGNQQMTVLFLELLELSQPFVPADS